MTPEQRSRLSALLAIDDADLTAVEKSEINFLSQLAASVTGSAPAPDADDAPDSDEDPEADGADDEDPEADDEDDAPEADSDSDEDDAPEADDAPDSDGEDQDPEAGSDSPPAARLTVGQKLVSLARSKVKLTGENADLASRLAASEKRAKSAEASAAKLKKEAKDLRGKLTAADKSKTTLSRAVADELAGLDIPEADLAAAARTDEPKEDVDVSAEKNPRKLIALGRAKMAASQRLN